LSPLRDLLASSGRTRGGKAEPNSPGARQADILIASMKAVDESMTKESQSVSQAAKSSPGRARSLAEIRQILRAHMPALAERYGIKSLGVFGSYVRGEARDTSDIDLLVEFSETPDIFKFMDLEEDLTAFLGLKVDLVTRPALKGNIGDRILREVVSA
jgi:predicted nucleotidyltransferase